MTKRIFTTEDAGRLLGLAHQFLADWREDYDKSDDLGDHRIIEREWAAMRPLLVQAPALLAALKTATDRLTINNCEGEEQPFIDAFQDIIAKAEGWTGERGRGS